MFSITSGSQAGWGSTDQIPSQIQWKILQKASTEESSSSDSDNALTNEAYLFMKKMLSYIVNCFMATGCDTLDVPADINDESLAEIEEIVKNEYPNESCTSHQYVSVDCYLCTLTPGCIE